MPVDSAATVVETRVNVGVLQAGATERAPAASTPAIEIKPAAGWPAVDYHEIWQARGLLFFLVWRDVKVRYAQSVLGAAWAVVQPVLTMVVFTFVFGNLAKIPSDGVPYAVFALAGLVPWTYFSKALGGSAGSLVTNSNLVMKVYFPRLIIPISPVFASLVDFAISFALLLVVALAFGAVPGPWALAVIPLMVLSMILTSVGLGAGLAALNIQYRDVKPIITFVLQIWMYATPIVYPLSLVPEKIRLAYMLNPMVGVVEGFRAVLLNSREIPWTAIGLSLLVATVLFLGGTRYFRRIENVFADVA